MKKVPLYYAINTLTDLFFIIAIQILKLISSINKTLTISGLESLSLNFLAVRLRANLQPLQYMDQEQPKEKEAPRRSKSRPWHAQVLLGSRGKKLVHYYKSGRIHLKVVCFSRIRDPRKHLERDKGRNINNLEPINKKILKYKKIKNKRSYSFIYYFYPSFFPSE